MKAKRPEVQVDTFELYLELADAIGVHLAKRISIHWFGEALFSYLLFPSKAQEIARYLERSRRDDAAFHDLDFGALIEHLRAALLTRLDSTDWSQYDLIGFSIVFAQTMPSLLTAREIKRRAPKVPIVLGGPSCTNLIGRSLLETFPFVDLVVNGEGERPLLHLVETLADGTPVSAVEVAGVVHRGSPPEAFGVIDQLDDMRELPPPDYSGYFRTVQRCQGRHDLLGRVRIPLETSRGCWWDRSHHDDMESCSFCNLNLQWHRYREKTVDQAVAEIRETVERYHAVDLTLVDNILRYEKVGEFVDAIEGLGYGLDIWMEARASVRPNQIRRLSEIGARVIQFGIEALSTSALKRMTKGTKTIQNLQVMKFCEQYGVKNTANLIVDFPGMDDEVIAETLRNIEFARGYQPLDAAEFSLVYQAPAYKAPERFDIDNIRSYHMYELLLPAQVYERLFLTEKSFDSESLDRLKPGWNEVRASLQAWRAHYNRMRPLVEGGLLLSLQDGGSFLKIRDFRQAKPRFAWLGGGERDVYLACQEIIALRDLETRYACLGRGVIGKMVDRWVEEKLAFSEQGCVLALAVPWGPVSTRRSIQASAPSKARVRIPIVMGSGAARG
jgi:ribosomal peptide maturation radical SAM protein 1